MILLNRDSERLIRLFYLLLEYLLLVTITLGYWVEMAEEMKAGNMAEKAGKGILIVLKWLVYPR